MYAQIKPGVVEVVDHRSLRAAWELYGWTGLVKTFKCRTPLTANQIRRLPAGLRACLAVR
jgi:hypothetical protein